MFHHRREQSYVKMGFVFTVVVHLLNSNDDMILI